MKIRANRYRHQTETRKLRGGSLTNPLKRSIF